MTHKELHEGINGSGDKVYQVVTVDEDGNWKWIEKFDTKAEALSWIQWS